jgi:hypothetical protein
MEFILNGRSGKTIYRNYVVFYFKFILQIETELPTKYTKLLLILLIDRI